MPFALRPAAMVLLHSALLKVLQAFFDNFQSDYRVQEAPEKPQTRDVEENADVFQLNISALYQLQSSWTSRYVQRVHGRRRAIWTGLTHTNAWFYCFCVRLHMKLRVVLRFLRPDLRDDKDLRKRRLPEHQHSFMLWKQDPV